MSNKYRVIQLIGPMGSGKTYFHNNTLIPYLGNNIAKVEIYETNIRIYKPDVIILFGKSVARIFNSYHMDRGTAIHNHIMTYINTVPYSFVVFHPKNLAVYAGDLSSLDYLFAQS